MNSAFDLSCECVGVIPTIEVQDYISTMPARDDLPDSRAPVSQVGTAEQMNREIIIPDEMREIVSRAGYAPAVKVGETIYVVGQVGRTLDLEVIEDPREQFRAMWENLRIVLNAAGCTFDDVVEMTSYHVAMSKHMDVFREAKNDVFPKGTYAWTRIGVSELAHPGLLAEVKCVAVKRQH